MAPTRFNHIYVICQILNAQNSPPLSSSSPMSLMFSCVTSFLTVLGSGTLLSVPWGGFLESGYFWPCRSGRQGVTVKCFCACATYPGTELVSSAGLESPGGHACGILLS